MRSNQLSKRLDQVQENAITSATNHLRSHGKCLIVMTTGTGKTRVATRIIEQFKNYKVLWITQTQELINQTISELEENFGEFSIGLYQRNQHNLNQRIIVASLQTIEKEKHLKTIPSDLFDLIVVDEAHHSRASTWERTISYFSAKKLGLTATPIRHDGLGLEDLFGSHAFELSYEEAKKLKLIAEEHYRIVLTNSKVNGLITRTGNYHPNSLDRLVVSENRNQIILDSYLRYGRAFMKEMSLPPKTLCFCISVKHAYRMKEIFKNAGLRAEVLIGRVGGRSSQETRTEIQYLSERSKIYDSFLKGKGPEVLCVINILNEGKNIPDVGCLLFARPTRSKTILQQQIGRGCRRIEGVKEKFIILDYVDLINQAYPPMSFSRLRNKSNQPEDFILDYYNGKDPLIVNEYIQYLSSNYSFYPGPLWTKEKIAISLQEFYQKHQKISGSDLSPGKTGLPNRTTIQRYWPSIKECLLDLGIPVTSYRSIEKWTKKDAIEKIYAFFQKHGKVRSTDLGRKSDLPSQKYIQAHWKKWSEFQKELNLEIYRKRKWNLPKSSRGKREPKELPKGIYMSRDKFRVEIWHKAVRYHVGIYLTLGAAKKAYDQKILEIRKQN